MADQPDNLVLRFLRDIRDDLSVVKSDVADIKRQFVKFGERIEHAAKEATYATGYAAQVNFSRDDVRYDIRELRSEVDDVKRRLAFVEDEGR